MPRDLSSVPVELREAFYQTLLHRLASLAPNGQAQLMVIIALQFRVAMTGQEIVINPEQNHELLPVLDRVVANMAHSIGYGGDAGLEEAQRVAEDFIKHLRFSFLGPVGPMPDKVM